jgi:hypothetical protein
MSGDEEAQEEMLNKYIIISDICNLDWRILNYVAKKLSGEQIRI